MKDIKTIMIGFLLATCMFLFMGADAKDSRSHLKYSKEVIFEKIIVNDSNNPSKYTIITPEAVQIVNEDLGKSTTLSWEVISLYQNNNIRIGLSNFDDNGGSLMINDNNGETLYWFNQK